MSNLFLESISANRTSKGVWSGTMSGDWMIGKVVSGGYATAVVLHCTTKELEASESRHVNVLSCYSHFLGSIMAGPYRVNIETLKAGKTMTTLQVSLLQKEKERLRFIVTSGNLMQAIEGGPNMLGISKTTLPPELPPVSECKQLDYIGDTRSNGIIKKVKVLLTQDDMDRYRKAREYLPDLSIDLDALEKRRKELASPKGKAEYCCYCEFSDGSAATLSDAPVFLDGSVPAVLGVYPTGWVPTINWTVQFKQPPAPGMMKMRVKTSNIVGGFLEEDAELWDSKGNLVALSRQLAMVNVSQPTQKKQPVSKM